MDNVCNRRLFSFPAKVEKAEWPGEDGRFGIDWYIILHYIRWFLRYDRHPSLQGAVQFGGSLGKNPECSSSLAAFFIAKWRTFLQLKIGELHRPMIGS